VEEEEESTEEKPPKIAIGRDARRRQVHVVKPLFPRRAARDRVRPAGHTPGQVLHRLRARRQSITPSIDTGRMLRRRGKVDEAGGEKFSVIKTMQAIEDANVVVLVVEAPRPDPPNRMRMSPLCVAGRTCAGCLAVEQVGTGWMNNHRDMVKSDIEAQAAFF